MAKGGKFAALAQFRQEQHIDDEAASISQPADPVKASSAETAAKPVVEARTASVEVAQPVQAESARPIEAVPSLAEIREIEEDVRPQARQPREPATKAVRPRGRPPGKRSDPDWKLFSHFLKRSTQRQATAILFEQDDGRDLSDVLQNLLEKWVSRERAKI